MVCYLDVSSVPTGASVYLNNNYIGETFLNDYRIEPGTYAVLIKKSGYEDWSLTLQILPTDLVRWIRAVLNPTGQQFGAIQFNSNPSGAEITMNDQPYGLTPRLIDNLPSGTYYWIYRKEGYKMVSGSAIVYPGQTTTIFRDLAPTEEPTPPIINYLPWVIGGVGLILLLSILSVPKE